jgi:arylformamidase
MSVFLDFDQAELDRQYSPELTVPDLDAYIREYAERSARARDELECLRDLAYGAHPDQVLDLFPAAQTKAPVMVFVHGGRWQMKLKDLSAVAAPAHVAAGALYVVLGFTPIPPNHLDGMVAQVREAIAWLHGHVARYGGDPERLHVSGHSSGAHLAAMLLDPGWTEGAGLPGDAVKSLLCVSGLYDLEPVRLSFRNDYVHLDDDAEQRLSPRRNLPSRPVPVTLGCAEHDTDEFRRQARTFDQALRANGHPGSLIEVPGCNHFDLLYALADPASALVRAAFAQMGIETGALGS